jgi:hypothetical protein
VISKAGVRNYHPIHPGELRVQWDVGNNSLDGTLIYPGARGREIYSSLRFESFRDGIEDLEYLYLLEAKDPKNPLLQVETVRNLTTYETKPAALLEFRRKVAEAISR